MAIKLNTPINSVENVNLPRASAAVITQNAVYTLVNGVTTLATATVLGTNPNLLLWIANQSLPSTDTTTTSVNCTMITRMRDIYLCDTVNSTATNQVGDTMTLDATGLLLDNTGTTVTTGSFIAIAIVGTTQMLAVRV